MIRETPTGVEVAVRVIPRARKSDVSGVRGGSLLVRLAAPPLDGAANQALVELLASRLNVAVRSVHIISGERSRNKRVAIAGVTAIAFRRALAIDG